jgi:fluoroquinolone resistance protein
VTFLDSGVLASEYENCTFAECDFTGSGLSKTKFINCVFDNCNFSNTSVSNTLFNDVKFHNCKLLGVIFSECNPFVVSLYFEDCQMNMASFYKLKLKGILFKDCSLQDVDFTKTDLAHSVFDNCDLQGAIFERTILKSADLRSSVNYSIDPEQNNISKAKFSIFGIVGLLKKYDITIEPV